MPGAKALVLRFSADYSALAEVFTRHDLSSQAARVLHDNAPWNCRESEWFIRLGDRVQRQRRDDFAKRQMARAVEFETRARLKPLPLRWMGQDCSISTSALEGIAAQGMPAEFARLCETNLARRRDAWSRWLRRAQASGSWGALWDEMRAQPRFAPPKSVLGELRDGVATITQRLRTDADPIQLRLGDVLKRGGAGNYFYLPIALGERDPHAARQMGQALYAQWRHDINSARDLTLGQAVEGHGSSWFGPRALTAWGLADPEDVVAGEGADLDEDDDPAVELGSWGEWLALELAETWRPDPSLTEQIDDFVARCVELKSPSELLAVCDGILSACGHLEDALGWLETACRGLDALNRPGGELLASLADLKNQLGERSALPEDNLFEQAAAVVDALTEGDLVLAKEIVDEAIAEYQVPPR